MSKRGDVSDASGTSRNVGTPPCSQLVRSRSQLSRSLRALRTARGLHVLMSTRTLVVLVPTRTLVVLVPTWSLVVLVPTWTLVVLVPTRTLVVLVPAGSRHSLVVDHRSQSGELPQADHHAEYHRCHFRHHVLLSGPLPTSGPLHSFRRGSRQEGARGEILDPIFEIGVPDILRSIKRGDAPIR